MSTLQAVKFPDSNGKSAKKPKALYLLIDSLISRIYDEDSQATIARRLDMASSRLTAEIYNNSDQSWPGVEIIFSGWGMAVMDEAFLARFPDLKIVFYGSGSVKPFVTETSWKSGVRITSAASANSIPVAEYTCSQIIQALKRSWQSALYVRREKKFPPPFHPPGAFQTTVGLLSLGMIGKMVAERLRSHDLNIVAYDPYVSAEEAERLNVTLLPLDEVFARADVVSCHTPLLPETIRMIRGRHFEMLKPEASFINTARGAIVAEDEMIEVLKKRPDIVALLDVTHPEPPEPDSPLYTLENVILTPHIAGSLGAECHRMGQHMVEELERYLKGKPLLYEVSEERTFVMA